MAENQNARIGSSPVLEIISGADKYTSAVDSGASAFKIISGAEAFRRYDWIRGSSMLNSANNLQGMVISGKWRVVFDHTTAIGDAAGRIAFFAAFASNIAERWGDVETIMRSSDSAGMKALRLLPIAGTAAQRTLAGIVTGPVSLMLYSMRGYCSMYGLLGGSAQDFSSQCNAALENTDQKMNAFVKAATDSDSQGQAIIVVAVKLGILK